MNLRIGTCRKGTSAIEFAILAPIFIMIIFTLIGYGIYLSAASSVEQIATDAARAAMGGLSTSERQALARSYISGSTMNHSFIRPEALSVDVGDDPKNAQQFTVRLTYDASNLPIWSLFSYALPSKSIVEFATIRIGGY